MTIDEAKADILDGEAAREEALREALPALREAIAATLPDAHKVWLAQLHDGAFDAGPLLRAAKAGWRVAYDRAANAGGRHG